MIKIGNDDDILWHAGTSFWDGKNNLNNYQSIGIFSSLENCSEAAYGRLYQLNAVKRGTYECGLNCEYNTDMGLKICERTAR